MKVIASHQTETDALVAYADSWEHLSDELRCLDVLIRLQALRQRRWQPASPLEQFRGLILTEEEVARLLDETLNPLTGDEPAGDEGADEQTLARILTELQADIRTRREMSLSAGIFLSLPQLSQAFHLSAFEEQCLIACLAPELHRKYEKLYAYLEDDLTRKKPSVDLVVNLLCQTAPEKLTARLAFEPHSTLLKYHFLQVTDSSPDGPSPLLCRFLKLDDRIVGFLLGQGHMDARLENFARLVRNESFAEQLAVTEAAQREVRSFMRARYFASVAEGESLIAHFYGPYGSGKQALAQLICRDLKLPHIIGDVGRIIDGPLPFAESLALLGREAVLQPAILCLENFDGLLADEEKHQPQLKQMLEVCRTFSRLTFLFSNHCWKPRGLLPDDVFVDLEFKIPDAQHRRLLWETQLNNQDRLAPDLDTEALASKFRFTAGQIRDALIEARNLARRRSPDHEQITTTDLYAACRAHSNQKLSAVAFKIQPRSTWDELVLPPEQKGQLHELMSHVKYRHVVYGEWGFEQKLSLGKGLSALFSGPSGTGKTMAAEVIAGALALDLYKIDLSQIVSKYIGETEKNLDRVFREAQTSNAILFFDEADALFGKRSEVKDAHDRYANIETGYLLQKMEEYEGVAILATNLRANLDEAFSRRMHFIVEFPFPDEEHRLRIWQGIFPRETPLASDADFNTLARSYKLSGGNIKNIALAAAFLAAEEGQAVGMSHLQQAVKREFHKVGKSWEQPGAA